MVLQSNMAIISRKIIRETSNISSLGLYLAFGSALTHAGLALILRKIGKTEHPATTALIHNLITSIVIIFLIIFFGTNFYGTSGQYGIEILITPNFILYTLIFLINSKMNLVNRL